MPGALPGVTAYFGSCSCVLYFTSWLCRGSLQECHLRSKHDAQNTGFRGQEGAVLVQLGEAGRWQLSSPPAPTFCSGLGRVHLLHIQWPAHCAAKPVLCISEGLRYLQQHTVLYCFTYADVCHTAGVCSFTQETAGGWITSTLQPRIARCSN